jgi:catechol 2,3-dioxygenase-like lactoylglutathione lyase family enzyme
MPKGHLEHANLTVSDPERSVELLKRLCGWHERWRGPTQSGQGWTIHVGGGDEYLAIYSHGGPVQRHAKGAPLNHVGLEVDDLAEAERVVIDAGLVPFNHMDYEPGRRFYFFDWDGIEFEVVSYR